MLKLLYRADGGHPIGTGHLFRAARIIRSLTTKVPVEALLVTAKNDSVSKILGDLPAEVCLLPDQIDPNAIKPTFKFGSVHDPITQFNPDIIVVDMLDTSASEMEALISCGKPVLTMDDRGDGRKFASAICNILVEETAPNLLSDGTVLHQGGRYVTLDPIFRDFHVNPAPRQFGPLENIFVAMGGADAVGLTLKVAKALKSVEGIKCVEFVAGPAFPYHLELERIITDAGYHSRVLSGLPDLLECYLRADLCIVAGGLTMYEVCCVGAPAVAVCQPIDHQYELAFRLHDAGALRSAGWGAELTPELLADQIHSLEECSIREKMSKNGREVTDGDGASRIADIIVQLTNKESRA